MTKEKVNGSYKSNLITNTATQATGRLAGCLYQFPIRFGNTKKKKNRAFSFLSFFYKFSTQTFFPQFSIYIHWYIQQHWNSNIQHHSYKALTQIKYLSIEDIYTRGQGTEIRNEMTFQFNKIRNFKLNHFNYIGIFPVSCWERFSCYLYI